MQKKHLDCNWGRRACFQIDGKLLVENNNGMHYSVS
jgi:hypothetical protein